MFDIKEDQNGVVVKVRVQPRASKNSLAGEMEGALKVRLTAPPVDGAANEACCKFFGELFGVAKSKVEIIAGHTGRNKLVHIQGVTEKQARFILK
ncbi:protein of unknown function DUF167 [Desulforamulus reducens MI-1]|uniref:UPF0235 protein Dred_0717 n=1 Tax=Desulforamulus reducens (strain ATCC BAA-1160 / DSM 100696 / MI-1) TaxID=349161 RepID=Y717_DESRM|nr:DUF167 domain-containing protein [Desulforamulus reducens]A4J2F3.1 RecName: Full=UPF0235 protein Dred_0717 [Desulforamulus reducens MI-1]ABO49256.1 protein of unknown function DUF167 [Desulforamulus reducens MI-1]